MITILYRHNRPIIIIPLWVILYNLSPEYRQWPMYLLRDVLEGR